MNDGRWKLIAHYAGVHPLRSELFDLENDPAETVNVVVKNRKVEHALRRSFEDVVAPPRRLDPLDPDTRERLRALGYVE